MTEAGFGTDCGFEKLIDVKCRAWLGTRRRSPRDNAAGAPMAWLERRSRKQRPEAVRLGCANMAKHAENIAAFGCPCVIALNVFDSDAEEDLGIVEREATKRGIPIVRSYAYSRGGLGTLQLAEAVVEAAASATLAKPSIRSIRTSQGRIEIVATRISGAEGVPFQTTPIGNSMGTRRTDTVISPCASRRRRVRSATIRRVGINTNGLHASDRDIATYRGRATSCRWPGRS